MRRILPAILTLLMVATAVPAAEKGAESHGRTGAQNHYVDATDMSQVPRLVRKILVRAVAAARRGEHPEAVGELQEHLREHPDQDHFLLRYHLARSHDEQQQYEAAQREYRRAVEMEPRLSEAWFGLGHVAYNLEDYAGSGAAFLKAFRTSADPQPETLYFAAAGYMLAEDHATAAPLLEELCSGKWGTPRHDWYAQLASCAIALERPELAGPLLQDYLAFDPGNDEAWFLTYQFHVGFEEFGEAAEALTIVSYLRELTPREERTLGDLYSLVEVPYLASEQYRAAMGEDARAEDYERLVSALVAAHDLDGALQTLQAGLQAAPTARLWSLLGDVHYLRQDYAAAAEAFGEVAALDPDNGRAKLMVGYCHLELGNRGRAIQNLVNAAKHDDQSELAQRLLARARKMSDT